MHIEHQPALLILDGTQLNFAQAGHVGNHEQVDFGYARGGHGAARDGVAGQFVEDQLELVHSGPVRARISGEPLMIAVGPLGGFELFAFANPA